MNGLTCVPAKEFGPKKIHVNSLNPGATETYGGTNVAVSRTVESRHLCLRFGTVEERGF
jgi:NAD(P)-dependent dehydrogenase (short-subunit alcohol dehydrogenase family)